MSARTITSCAYHRMDMMSMRYRLRMFYYTLHGVVKAHSSKHSKYVAIPKPLMYHLLDELDGIIDDAYKKSTVPNALGDALTNTADAMKEQMVEAFMEKPMCEWRRDFRK